MSTPEGLRNPLGQMNVRTPGKNKFVEARINQGMVTSIDPADLDPGMLQRARNARCRFDRTSRRPGSLLLTPTKPNSIAIVGLAYHKTNNNVKRVIRFTPSTIHYLNAGAWTNVPADVGPPAGSLTGAVTDRFRAVTLYDRFVFTNNGVDVIQEIDFTVPEYKPLGNAPKYKFITGFYERLVGANLVDSASDPTQLGWSAQGNIDEWDPLTDESAGSAPLTDSPSDRADFITGLFGFTNVMIILRERSIWLATKQPIAQNPFYAYTAFPGLGCDAPNSAVVALNGLIWLDTRSETVWFYSPGGEPDPIGRPIEKDLIRGITDQSQVFASFDPIEHEYTVCVPVSTGIVKCWTFNFRTKAWTYDERPGITSINDIDFALPTTTIDDLGDIPIDQLQGTIDDLSPDREDVPTRFFGRSDGEILQEDDEAYVDPAFGADFDGVFTTELVSKSIHIPTDDIYVCEINLELIPRAGGDITIQYSKNGGVTFATPQKLISVESGDIGKPIQYRWVKHIRCRKFAWRLLGMGGQWDLVNYTVYVHKGAESAQK